MSASADVESQTPGARPRGRCLDGFLTVSVIALFVLFGLALAGALLFAKHIEHELNSRTAKVPMDSATMSAMHGIPAASYKMQNFAYLEATQAELNVGVMPWAPVVFGSGQSVGSLYSFNKEHQALQVIESGVYFLYVQLNFSCTFECKSGRYTIGFYNQLDKQELDCSVSLPKGHKPVTHTCWNVVTFPEKGNRLVAKTDFQGDLKDWKLEFVNSGFGIFLIDGLPAVRST